MKTVTTILLLILTVAVSAQDKIIQNNAEMINCKVTEIAADEVKYYYRDSPKLIFGIDKDLVISIEFAAGEIIEVEDNTFRNPAYYANK